MMAKPTVDEIRKFIVFAFGKVHAESLLRHNLDSWINRFESPVKVWSYSDYDRRDALKKFFPKKFGKLDKDTNLNNPEYNTNEWNKW